MNKSLPRTPDDTFVFVAPSSDLAFCKPQWMNQILARIEQLPSRRFLIPSKNPASLRRYKFSENVFLGTTIETDRDDLYKEVDEAKELLKAGFDFIAEKDGMMLFRRPKRFANYEVTRED